MEDEVDRMSARLQTQRPSLDVSTLALSDRVIRLARHLEIGRREALAARELDVWEYDVLLALRAAESNAGLSPSGLMAATQVASGTVTNRIDRLARRGFVTREPDPADRRGVLVRLSAAGRRRIDHAASDVAAAESATWARIGQRRLDQLTTLLRETLVGIESSTA
jgi:DNA-binding MarR family transcriptional regulator